MELYLLEHRIWIKWEWG